MKGLSKKGILFLSIIFILFSIPVYAAGETVETIGEVGYVDVSGFNFVTVPFTNVYNSVPVVIATPATDNRGDNNSLIPVIRNITRQNFTIALCKDAGQAACSSNFNLERIHYYVFDVDKTKNLTWIDVGTVSIKPDGRNKIVNWAESFNNLPYVFASAQTYNQNGNVGATIWVDGINKYNANKFIACTHRGTGHRCDSNTPNETFGYVALDPKAFKILNSKLGNKSIANSKWTLTSYNSTLNDPVVMVLMNDDNGGDDPKYPLARGVTNSNVQIRYCEQAGSGVCGPHTSENVMWFAMDKGNISYLVNITNSTFNQTNTTINNSTNLTNSTINNQTNVTNQTVNNSTQNNITNTTYSTTNGGISNPNLTLTQINLPLQNPLVPFVEPTFNTTLIRITNRSQSNSYATQIYSQLQAFSSDNKYLLYIDNEDYQVYDLENNRFVMSLGEVNNPRWQPGLQHTIVAYDDNADSDLSVLYFNVDTGAITTPYVFPSNYVRISVNPSFDELSHDGKWMSGIAIRNDGEEVVFAVDLQNRRLGAQIPINQLYNSVCARDPTWGVIYPDWTAASPLGRYLVVQWPRDGTSRCSGLETFNIETGAFVGRITDDGQHGDLGVMPNGNEEFFMTFEVYHPSGELGIGYRMLPGTNTVSQTNYINTVDWNGEHISCQGPNGVCLVTTRNSGSLSPFDNELFLQNINGSVLRLTHHRSTACGYWVQPRATISRDGSKVAFASDWLLGTGRDSCGSSDLGQGDLYIINLLRNTNTITQPVVNVSNNISNNSIINLAVNKNLGVNVASVDYYSPQWIFVDAMKHSGEWITGDAQGGGAWDTQLINSIPLDSNGYPLEIPYTVNGVPQKVRTTLFWNLNGHYPGGNYTVLYDGEGDLSFMGDIRVFDHTPGRYLINVIPNGGIVLTIERSQLGNNLRNIRFIMPSFENNYQEQIFHPLFLERMQNLSAIRFMDLGKTNHNVVRTWDERTTTNTYTQSTSKGMAVEYMIDLSNKAEKDMWVNVPHMADDNYVRNLARMIQNNLEPDKKIYVEYSNEVWNGIFNQTAWIQQQGCSTPSTFVATMIPTDTGIIGCEDLYSGLYYQAKRSSEIFNIFEQEFGSESGRVINVVASQTENTWMFDRIFEAFDNPAINPSRTRIEAMAIAPYFGYGIDEQIVRNNEVNSITVNEILNRAETQIDTNVKDWMVSMNNYANGKNIH